MLGECYHDSLSVFILCSCVVPGVLSQDSPPVATSGSSALKLECTARRPDIFYSWESGINTDSGLSVSSVLPYLGDLVVEQLPGNTMGTYPEHQVERDMHLCGVAPRNALRLYTP